MARCPKRRLRYHVVMSLDGFIAGPKGEYDWIPHDPKFDFGALYRQFDTVVIGRRTYEAMLAEGQSPAGMGMKAVVVSTTLDAGRHPGVTIIGRGVPEAIAALKSQPGKDIWLFGGGVLFRSLLDAGLVDTVEVAVAPVLLGGGVRLLPDGHRWPLRLEESRTMPSGIVMLSYVTAPESLSA